MAHRITAVEVLDAYRKHNVKVCRKRFTQEFEGEKYCCPLAVLALDAGENVFNDDFSVGDWAIEKFGQNYQRGFWTGIDGRPSPPAFIDENIDDDYYKGRKDAVEVLEALRENKLL